MLDIIKSQLTDVLGSDDERSHKNEDLERESKRDAVGSREGDTGVGSTNQALPQERPIELDVVFDLLKNRRRRDILHHLVADNEEIQLGPLAEQIAAREYKKEVSEVHSQERKRVYISLYQCHLPKLADIGAITYNKPRGIVERGPTFDQLARYLPDDESLAAQNASNSQLRELLFTPISTIRKFL